ncbi:MAG TPA: putative sulfate exporter family transporter [Phycisphaerales bacterium]|nr:putative sulfate exporter family transporter [Phycisphaerales bacterium]
MPDPSPTTTDAPRSSNFEPRLLLMALAAVACLLPWITPPIALMVGIVLALLGLTTRTKQATRLAKTLIQIAVVMLGLGMDLRQVGEAGLVGIVFAAGTIVGTFALGIALGRALRTEAKLTTLLSSGTAICGGSAIAATASVIAATEAQIAVAMGAVFLLNALAIYLFPPLGHALGMSAHQFGTWAAVAIHDVSSVVTAAGVYDRRWPDPHNASLAAQTATAVKLTRTLWIAPVAIVCAWWFRSHGDEAARKKKGKIPIPWFVLWFVLAACVGTMFANAHKLEALKQPVPELNRWITLVSEWCTRLAKDKLMAVALMLIGCGLSPRAVMHVGWRAMVLSVCLWVAISGAALWAVLHSIG